MSLIDDLNARKSALEALGWEFEQRQNFFSISMQAGRRTKTAAHNDEWPTLVTTSTYSRCIFDESDPVAPEIRVLLSVINEAEKLDTAGDL